VNEAVLQALLILAYLAIGLVSVTFPIYAIAVNFLPQQKWESEKQRSKRIAELKGKITRISSELGAKVGDSNQIKSLRDQLDKYENELRGTKLRVNYLTVKGAVIVPVAVLLVALVFSIIGLYAYYKDLREWAIGLGVISALGSGFASYRLYKTVSAVEYGALSPERTIEFDVGFIPKLLGEDAQPLETTELKTGTETRIRIGARTTEYDVENFELRVFIPKNVQVVSEMLSGAGLVVSRYEDVTILGMREDCVFKELGVAISANFLSNEVGTYQISVLISAKGIYSFHKNLSVVVT
jgi:hypothetical protein